MVWGDLKPLKVKKKLNSIFISLGQKLLHARDENLFVPYHLQKPYIKLFRPYSKDIPGISSSRFLKP